MGDELFPKKDGKMLTCDIDYVDVWRVRTHVLFLFACALAPPQLPYTVYAALHIHL